MQANYEQRKILRAALERYRKAERVSREKKEAFVKRIIFFFFICIIACVWQRRDGAFINICATGTAEDVRAAIARNIWNVNMTVGFFESVTPYITAARHNPNPEVLKILEQAGAKADKNKLLEEATKYDNVNAVRFLVQNAGINKDYALDVATNFGKLEIVKFLLQDGGINKDYALDVAANFGKLEIVKFLLQDGATTKNEALYLAKHTGKSDVANFLAKNGAKADDLRELLRTNHYINKDLLVNDIRSRPAVTEQEIIRAAKKYDFEIVAHKNQNWTGTRDGKTVFNEKIIAREDSRKGVAIFCAESICKEEGYYFFSPDSFWHKKYSDWRNDPSLNADSLRSSIRSWLSDKLSGELLDRAVNVLMELCY